MKLFECPACNGSLFFANLSCGTCGTPVEYVPDQDSFALLERPCANRGGVEECNWRREGDYACDSCVLDLDAGTSSERAPFQRAKRRVLRQLHRHSVVPRKLVPQLRFDLRASSAGDTVTTGHAGGVVTIDITEGDPAHRESVRAALGEPYRTPLGHVRHELGHWWWAVWSATADASTLTDIRRVFGDESTDYSEALASHYDRADDGSWRERYISFYASSHPFEDFAESFAHFLHMADTLETGIVHGLVAPPESREVEHLFERWAPLTVALNELSRSMGTDEPYPFAPSRQALEKVRVAASTLPT